jgi:hypothetical protein
MYQVRSLWDSEVDHIERQLQQREKEVERNIGENRKAKEELAFKAMGVRGMIPMLFN